MSQAMNKTDGGNKTSVTVENIGYQADIQDGSAGVILTRQTKVKVSEDHGLDERTIGY